MAPVYLDSGHDLSAVWAVYTKLFPNLESVIANPVSTVSSPIEYLWQTCYSICVTFQPRSLERQLYEEFPDATSTREKVGSKVVVELHLEEGGTTYRGLGYNNRLALIAACRSSVALLANKMLQISLEGWVFLLLAVGVSWQCWRRKNV